MEKEDDKNEENKISINKDSSFNKPTENRKSIKGFLNILKKSYLNEFGNLFKKQFDVYHIKEEDNFYRNIDEYFQSGIVYKNEYYRKIKN